LIAKKKEATFREQAQLVIAWGRPFKEHYQNPEPIQQLAKRANLWAAFPPIQVRGSNVITTLSFQRTRGLVR
jgi:hypothetical protein